MEDWSSYPPVEPSNFDLIVIGTGLPESILAAAASAAGKTVLHLDPNPFYGCHFASLPLPNFVNFLQTHSKTQPSPQPIVPNSSNEFENFPLTTRSVYSSVEITVDAPEIKEESRKFNLDLAGPRALFCADTMIDLILRTDINQYMDFRSVDSTFICEGGECDLWNVPDSRSAIFKDKSLSFSEKNQLMRFFKLVEKHYADETDEENSKISEEDLESPFVEFLSKKIGISPKLKSVILYAISMADYEQDDVKVCKNVLKTKEGIDRLILYHSSVGRFPNVSGAMIYPIYGHGELPQAFCRRAAVKGCLYVLRMPVVGLLGDKDVGNYKGIKLVTGQEIFSHKLILAPSFVIPSRLALSPLHFQPDCFCESGLPVTKDKLARGICITKSSLKSDVANCLVFYPPRCELCFEELFFFFLLPLLFCKTLSFCANFLSLALCPEQLTSVRAFQLSSNVAACPSDMFVVYLSTVCEDDIQGKKLINEAINALFTIPASENLEENSTEREREFTVENAKPTLLWSILYIQDLMPVAFDCVSSTFMPDGNLGYNDLLNATTKLFHEMFPNEVFFPKTTSSDAVVEDVESEI